MLHLIKTSRNRAEALVEEEEDSEELQEGVGLQGHPNPVVVGTPTLMDPPTTLVITIGNLDVEHGPA